MMRRHALPRLEFGDGAACADAELPLRYPLPLPELAYRDSAWREGRPNAIRSYDDNTEDNPLARLLNFGGRQFDKLFNDAEEEKARKAETERQKNLRKVKARNDSIGKANGLNLDTAKIRQFQESFFNR
jgi:hypothetical protein